MTLAINATIKSGHQFHFVFEQFELWVFRDFSVEFNESLVLAVRMLAAVSGNKLG